MRGGKKEEEGLLSGWWRGLPSSPIVAAAGHEALAGMEEKWWREDP